MAEHIRISSDDAALLDAGPEEAARQRLLTALLVERYTPIPPHPERRPATPHAEHDERERKAASIRHLRLVHDSRRTA